MLRLCWALTSYQHFDNNFASWIYLVDKHFLISNAIAWSPACESCSPSPSWEIPCIVWNPKCPFCVHNILPHVSIMSQMNPVHAFPSYFFLRSNPFAVILPCLSSSFKHSFSSGFPHQNPVYVHFYSHPCMLHAVCISSFISSSV